MEQIFLTSEKGLTSTSANYLCNIAKEHIKTLQKELEDFSAFDEFKQLIGTSNCVQTAVGKENIGIFKDYIKAISNLNAFVAWLREAITYKDGILSNAVNKIYDQMAEQMPVMPQRKTYTEDDIMKTWSQDKIVRYYTLEAKAAHYGKLIHPSGTFAKFRDGYYKKLYKPKSISGEGRDAIITSLSPAVPEETVEEIFMSLQAKYREYEKQFNALKFELKEEADNLNRQELSAYTIALSEYQAELNQFNADKQKRILDEQERIGKLKIVVPERFNEIFKLLNEMVDSSKA